MKNKLIALLTTGMLLTSATTLPPVLAAAQTPPAPKAAPLPGWIPNNPESAVEFRNTYGATHIADGLICVVSQIELEPVPEGEPQGILRYDVIVTDESVKSVRHTLFAVENRPYYYDIAVFDPQQVGDFDISIVDTWAEDPDPDLQYGHAITRYSFSVKGDTDITETDIYGWLPDCETEYNTYIQNNKEISVKDNYVVFCLTHTAGTPYHWTESADGRECFELEADSDCCPIYLDPPSGGPVNSVYAYKAVKDGYAKISYDFGASFIPDDENQKTLTADCAVINNAQTVLLSGDMRVTLVDYDTNEQIVLTDDRSPAIWTNISNGEASTGPILIMEDNPAIVDNHLGKSVGSDSFSFGLDEKYLPNGCSFIDDEKRPGYYSGTIIPDDHMTVTRFDNGSADIVFRLKKDNAISKKSTTITFYDADTDELIDIPEGNTYLLKCTSGEQSTSEIFDVKTNPCTLESAYVYEKSCNYSFHTDSISGWYDSLKFEKISENSNSVELTCRMKWTPSGDANHDGSFSIADLVLTQEWLLGKDNAKIYDWKAVDYCRDNSIDVFDLILMRKALLKSVNLPVEVSVKEETGGVTGAVLLYRVYREAEKCYLSYQDMTTNWNAEPLAVQISESEYQEIMTQDYESMLQNMPPLTEPESDESVFNLELSYSDGSKIKAASARMPDIMEKLRALKKKYFSFVEPEHRSDYGRPFIVVEDGLPLYTGPDESYPSIASLPVNTFISELGYQKNNDKWLFTKYKGQYGWIKIVKDDNVTPTIRFEMMADKPVIYLYPEEKTDVHVELELTEADLSTTYPRYNNGWDVTAYPDGSLLNKADGSNHKYLFWDAVNCRTRYDLSKGFCIAGKDTESFLKEKLKYMGLTEEEMNEFIVYWLPRMEHNAYNLITFQGDSYTNSAKLDITPTPDSLLRVFMVYVPLEDEVDIEPQQLETFERNGFTVVEWGGSEIRS